MIDLSCKYLGLQLKNPLIVGSSGLTSSIENLKTIARKGAGGIVLKSIFEEQIKFEAGKLMSSANPDMKSWKQAFQGIVSKTEFYYDEAFEYLTSYAKEHNLNQYLTLISDAKKVIDIPVIACVSASLSFWS